MGEKHPIEKYKGLYEGALTTTSVWDEFKIFTPGLEREVAKALHVDFIIYTPSSFLIQYAYSDLFNECLCTLLFLFIYLYINI
jgi:hypothetical protein